MEAIPSFEFLNTQAHNMFDPHMTSDNILLASKEKFFNQTDASYYKLEDSPDYKTTNYSKYWF